MASGMRAIAYWFLWIPVLLSGCAASFGALSLVNALDLRYLPYWIVMLLNLAPAFGCGVLFYGLVDLSSRSHTSTASRRVGHLWRTTPLYIVGAILVAFIAENRHDRSFGLVAQLFVWPLMTSIGGIIGDTVRGRRSRGSSVESAA